MDNSSTTHLCNFDMNTSGYSLDKGTLSVTYNWLRFNYLNLEYYTGDLSGNNRIHWALSDYIWSDDSKAVVHYFIQKKLMS